MIYATVELTIKNAESFAAYAEKAGEALKKYGGAPVAMSENAQRIEGDRPEPTRAVIISFPDKDAALGWMNDPDFQETHALRRGAGQSEILLLG